MFLLYSLLYYSLYFLLYHCTFVVFDYRTCLGLGYCIYSNSAVQLFSCKYVTLTIKLS